MTTTTAKIGLYMYRKLAYEHIETLHRLKLETGRTGVKIVDISMRPGYEIDRISFGGFNLLPKQKLIFIDTNMLNCGTYHWR